MESIVKGSRVEVFSKKNNQMAYGTVTKVKGDIIRMVTDDQLSFIRGHVSLFKLSDHPIIPDTRLTFKVSAWVHPQDGGDDENYTFEVRSPSEEDCRKYVISWLKRRKSAILNDYSIKQI